MSTSSRYYAAAPENDTDATRAALEAAEAQAVLEPPMSTIASLPPELRLEIWSCSAEPRIVILNDLLRRHRSYAIPSTTQVSAEARHATRDGYEPVGKGSHFHFSRDILVCGEGVLRRKPDESLKRLARRIKRLAFWDCSEDDPLVAEPLQYQGYLRMYGQRGFGRIDFDQTLFPNLHELWIVKFGDVHPEWHTQGKVSYEFRYWRDQRIIEIAPLNRRDANIGAILREGRCEDDACQLPDEKLRLFKITFMSGRYPLEADDDAMDTGVNGMMKDDKQWELVRLARDGDGKDSRAHQNLMRWTMAERALTFSLNVWADSDEPQETKLFDRLRAAPPQGPDATEGSTNATMWSMAD